MKDLGMFPIVNRGDGEAAPDTDEIAVFDIPFALELTSKWMSFSGAPSGALDFVESVPVAALRLPPANIRQPSGLLLCGFVSDILFAVRSNSIAPKIS